MPDTKRKTRNAKSPLTLGQALDRSRDRFLTCDAREKQLVADFRESEAQWHAALASRLAEHDRPLFRTMLAAGLPVQAAAAAEGPPDDAEPVYTAERMQHGLTPERLAVARGR